jgi:hypothetical protein
MPPSSAKEGGGEGCRNEDNRENQHQSGAARAFGPVKSACDRRLAHVLVPCLYWKGGYTQPRFARRMRPEHPVCNARWKSIN